MVRIHQHVKFQAIPSMCSPANAQKPLRTDWWTCRKTVTVGRVDQRTDVQVKRGYFRLRMDGRTDGQPENIMPSAPKGRGIKICSNPLAQLLVLPQAVKHYETVSPGNFAKVYLPLRNVKGWLASTSSRYHLWFTLTLLCCMQHYVTMWHWISLCIKKIRRCLLISIKNS